MSNIDPTIPTRRGRRDPELAARLDAEVPVQITGEMMDDDLMGEDQEGGSPGVADYALMPGDMIMAKTTLAYQTPMGDAWSTFGAQTHLLQDESIDDAFERVATIVNSGVIELGNDAVERVNEVQRTNRITPRR